MGHPAQKKRALPDDCVELFSCKLGVHAEDALPEWVHFCPAGEQGDDGHVVVEGRDGRFFVVSDPQAVIDRTELPMQFDWDHESMMSFFGGSTRAAGWIDRIEFVDEPDQARPARGFWGHVERWTPDGERDVRNLYYRGLSPVVRYRMQEVEEGEFLPFLASFENVALTNRPNLKMTLLNAEEPQPQPKELPMSLKKLAKRLGLAEDADADKVADAAHAALDRDVVPAEQLHAANARIAELEADAEKAAATRHAEAVERALEQASKDGKIAPASLEQFRAMCGTPEGLESFKKLAATLPKIVADDPTSADEHQERPHVLTEDEKLVAAKFGMTDDEFNKHRQAAGKGA